MYFLDNLSKKVIDLTLKIPKFIDCEFRDEVIVIFRNNIEATTIDFSNFFKNVKAGMIATFFNRSYSNGKIEFKNFYYKNKPANISEKSFWLATPINSAYDNISFIFYNEKEPFLINSIEYSINFIS